MHHASSYYARSYYVTAYFPLSRHAVSVTVSCSYACMQRSWNVPSHERFSPPAGCGRINSISSLEATAAHSMRTLQRFVGQCNIVTHIKEATFVGPDDHIVACGSDHGNVFLFDSLTGELLRVLYADQEVANCVQCHPSLPVLATSGLEYVVRFAVCC
jgi:WD40 repeat protein